MQFKSYVSALFYLNEATKYLEGQPQENIQEALGNLLNQGFRETGNVGFKVFVELKRLFPELEFSYGSARNTFCKSTSHFLLRREYTPQNCPFDISLNQDYEREEELDEALFKGGVVVKANYYGSHDHTNYEPDDFYANTTVAIHLEKCKEFNDADFNKLVNMVRRLLFER